MSSKNWILFLVLATCWGLSWPIQKIGLTFVSPFTFVFHRFIFSAIFSLPLVPIFFDKIPRDHSTLTKLVFLSMLNLSHFIVTCVGLTKEGSGVAAVLTYTSPLFVFGLTVLFLKDKIATTGLLGSLLGFSGILVIFMNRMVPLRLQTILLLLAGAFLWAASTVYYKRCLSNVDPFVAGFLQIYLGIGPLLVVSTVSESVVYPLHTTTYFLVMLYASLAGTVIASTLWLILVNKEDITVVSGSSFAVPIFAFLFGWMLLGESFETKAMIGAVLVIVGVYLVNSTSRFDSHMRTFENSIKAFIQRLDNKD